MARYVRYTARILKNEASPLKYLISFALLIFANIAFAANEPVQLPCYKKPSFVKMLGVDQAKPIYEEFLKREKNKEFADAQLYGMYQADINSDKKLEDILVFHDSSGTLNALEILTLDHHEKDKNLGPPNPRDGKDGPFYFQTYTNKSTGTDEFLTQMCGNTYMVFDLGGDRDAYLEEW